MQKLILGTTKNIGHYNRTTDSFKKIDINEKNENKNDVFLALLFKKTDINTQNND